MTTISTVTPFSVVAPTRADSATFSSRGDTIMTEMVALVPDINTTVGEMNTVAGEVNASAAAAATSETNAAASATAAAVTANAVAWVAGNYAFNANAISGIDGQTYRNFVAAGVRNTDPKNDPTNWVKLGAPAELWTKGSPIASAATINLTTATGDYVHVTGTTTITAITIPVGAERTVIFDGALTLTHGAALLLPGAANITTAANDRMTVRGDTAGAIVVSYTRASGLPVVSTTPGTVLLATLTPTAAANVDFLNVFTSSYDSYLIVGTGLSCSVTDQLVARFAVGGVVDTSSAYYTNSSTSQKTTTSAEMWASSNVESAGFINFSMSVQNVNSATQYKSIQTNLMAKNSSTSWSGAFTWGIYPTANAVSGIRFFFVSAANFVAGGNIRIYGISNA